MCFLNYLTLNSPNLPKKIIPPTKSSDSSVSQLMETIFPALNFSIIYQMHIKSYNPSRFRPYNFSCDWSERLCASIVYRKATLISHFVFMIKRNSVTMFKIFHKIKKQAAIIGSVRQVRVFDENIECGWKWVMRKLCTAKLDMFERIYCVCTFSLQCCLKHYFLCTLNHSGFDTYAVYVSSTVYIAQNIKRVCSI